MGDRIRLLREKRGLTRYALAHKIHCEPISIMLWEEGATTPTARSVQKMADFFGVTVGYILNGGDTE